MIELVSVDSILDGFELTKTNRDTNKNTAKKNMMVKKKVNKLLKKVWVIFEIRRFGAITF